jgi:hypothetical protein
MRAGGGLRQGPNPTSERKDSLRRYVSFRRAPGCSYGPQTWHTRDPAISAQAPDAARAVVNKIWYSNSTKFLKDGTSLYPRFHAERESPIDHRIKYEGHRPLADDGRLRWFLRS